MKKKIPKIELLENCFDKQIVLNERIRSANI